MIFLLNPGNTICLSCAAINNIDTESRLCGVCGEKHDPQAFKVLYNFSSECVEYGYLYRSLYESDLDEGVSRRYSLAPFDEYLIFAATAAISGIIGNFTYDVVKAVIRRIANSAPKAEAPSLGRSNIQHLQDDKNIDIFIENIAVYLKHLPGVDSKVIAAIMDEMLTHEIQRILEDPKRPKIDISNLKEFKKVQQKAIRNLRERMGLRPTKKQFQNLWKRFRDKDAKI